MKKHVTDCEELFLSWFPEMAKCPVCKGGKSLFQNFRVIDIKIKVKDYYGKPVEFRFTKSPNINPLADYRS